LGPAGFPGGTCGDLARLFSGSGNSKKIIGKPEYRAASPEIGKKPYSAPLRLPIE
jgi:hypothetical protein